MAQWLNNLPAVQELQVVSLGREDPLEEEMATHSSILAWKIPTDRGAWRATVHGVEKSWTWLSMSLEAQMVRNLPAMQETWVWSVGQEDPLEKGMAIHSSILAWRIPWTGEWQLMGYSPWGCKESDTTEQLTTATSTDESRSQTSSRLIWVWRVATVGIFLKRMINYTELIQ